MHRALLCYDTGYHGDRVKIVGVGEGGGADARGSLVCATPPISVPGVGSFARVVSELASVVQVLVTKLVAYSALCVC